MHMYSNEAERDMYGDFKVKKSFGLHGFYKNSSTL